MANESLYQIGVKAVIKNASGKYLIIQSLRHHDNQVYWDLPGGRIEEGETAADTLKREVAQEAGITDLSIERPLAMALSGVRLPLDDGKQVGLVLDAYACSTAQGQLKFKDPDNLSGKWCPASEVAALLRENQAYPRAIINAIAAL